MSPESSTRLPLVERLRPSRLDRIVGNPRARQQLRAWADRWDAEGPPSKRAAVLAGPPGVGKTTAALALASERGWTVVEMNASDARNQSAIEQVAGRASISRTIDAPAAPGARGRTLILLDEADCLTGRLTEAARTVTEPLPLREFLHGRYGTVAALNAAWGLGTTGRTKPFPNWDAVPKSPGNFGWARLPAARRDLDDWRASGRPVDHSDRGGLGAIARLVRSTRQPLVLTVNDESTLHRYSPVFRTAAEVVRFDRIPPGEIAARLSEIVRSERFDVDPRVVPAIVARARGDLRAALNDLEAVAALPAGPPQVEVVSVRDRTVDLADLTAEALTSARVYRVAEIRERVDATPDDLLPWVEENVVQFAPSPARLAAAFEVLAVADRFLRRASRTRTWSQWSYASELMTGGVGIALGGPAASSPRGANFPRFLGAMGRSRVHRAVRDSLCSKIGAHLHLSTAKVRSHLLAEIEGLVQAERGRRPTGRLREVRARIVRELELTREEAALLLDVPPDDEEVDRALGGTEAPERESVVEDRSGGPSAEPPPAVGARPGPRGRVRPLSEFPP